MCGRCRDGHAAFEWSMEIVSGPQLRSAAGPAQRTCLCVFPCSTPTPPPTHTHAPAYGRLLRCRLLCEHPLQVKAERLAPEIGSDRLVAAVEADGGEQRAGRPHVGKRGAQPVAVFAAGGGVGALSARQTGATAAKSSQSGCADRSQVQYDCQAVMHHIIAAISASLHIIRIRQLT